MRFAVVILALGCCGFCFWGIKLSLELSEARDAVRRLERRLLESYAASTTISVRGTGTV